MVDQITDTSLALHSVKESSLTEYGSPNIDHASTFQQDGLSMGALWHSSFHFRSGHDLVVLQIMQGHQFLFLMRQRSKTHEVGMQTSQGKANPEDRRFWQSRIRAGRNYGAVET